MIDSLEKLIYWFGSFGINADAAAACLLRGPVDDTTFSAKNGDYLSFVELRGSRLVIGPDEFDTASQNITSQLAILLGSSNGKKHSISLSFRSDPYTAGEVVRRIHSPMRDAGRSLNVADYSIIDSQEVSLSARGVRESLYLVVVTHADALTPNERKLFNLRRARSFEVMKESMKKAGHPLQGAKFQDEVAQSPLTGSPSLLVDHSAAVNGLIEFLNLPLAQNGAGMVARVLDVHSALIKARSHIDVDLPPEDWRPVLAGDHFFATSAHRKNDASGVFPSPIGRQVVSESIHEHFGSFESATKGRYEYAQVVLEQCANNGEGWVEFNSLISKIKRTIPWSCSIEISPNGMERNRISQLMTAFLGGFGDENRRINAGWRDLQSRRSAGDPPAALRMIFSTWGSNRAELAERLAVLKVSIEGWGSTSCTNETGIPGHGVLAQAGGFSSINPAPYVPGPLGAFARMAPFFRPASVYDDGQVIAQTIDGVPYPIKFFSPMQTVSNAAVFAPTGRGKSFFMMMLFLGLILTPGGKDVPYVLVIDVGPSSKLIMDLVRDMLPPEKRRQVVSIKIRNTREYTVNLFDTQHGLDQPTENDIDFQVGMVSTMCVGLGDEGPAYVRKVIRAVYKKFGRDSRECRYWDPTIDRDLTEVVERAGIVIDSKTRVWDIVDALFDKGLVQDSARAQRYAVPVLEDLVSATSDYSMADYANATAGNGENLRDYFCRQIPGASETFAILSGVTAFDLGDARAVSLDLEELVNTSGSQSAVTRKAIMYLYGRRLGAKNYFLRWDEISSIVPKRYVNYQRDRVSRLQVSPKFLAYDELHYTSDCPLVTQQIETDQRVVRKYNLATLMSSQDVRDFPEACVMNANNFFILGADSEDDLNRVQSIFNLSEAEKYAIKTHCVGPGRFFFRARMIDGPVSQALFSTASPMMRWAFTTAGFDSPLRNMLADAVGISEAARRLAIIFPSGSARDAAALHAKRQAAKGEADELSTMIFFKNKALALDL